MEFWVHLAEGCVAIVAVGGSIVIVFAAIYLTIAYLDERPQEPK